MGGDPNATRSLCTPTRSTHVISPSRRWHTKLDGIPDGPPSQHDLRKEVYANGAINVAVGNGVLNLEKEAASGWNAHQIGASTLCAAMPIVHLIPPLRAQQDSGSFVGIITQAFSKRYGLDIYSRCTVWYE